MCLTWYGCCCVKRKTATVRLRTAGSTPNCRKQRIIVTVRCQTVPLDIVPCGKILVFVPERHVDKLFKQVGLQAGIDRRLLSCICCYHRLLDHAVDPHIIQAPAVGARRWQRLTVKRVAEDVRRFHPDPGQAVHLETTGLDITVERTPVVTLYIHLYSRQRQLLLQDGRDTYAKRVTRRFIADA